MTDTLLSSATQTTPATPVDDGLGTELIDEPLVCAEILDITHDVKSFSFVRMQGAQTRFLPGQYLTFRFDIDGSRIERCYTISSSPTRPELLTITVKRVPGGPVSNWLHDRLKVGDTLSATGPLGQFSYALHPSEQYLFISAGSGITPSMSMVRALSDRQNPAAITFVHCARTPADIIFRHELEELDRRPNVTVVIVCERDSADQAWAAETWTGERGRLSLPVLLQVAPELLAMQIFSCGPPPFMDSVREMLGQLCVDPGACHEESFVLGNGGSESSGGSEAGAASRPTALRHQVQFQRSGRTIDCDSATPLLTAAARAGLTLPSSCGEGVCGTCKSGLLSGDVDMRPAGGIRQREIDEGKILLCCSTPTTDLVIDA